MTAHYEVHGALGSPYSLKIRALMRYRRLPHIWVHGAATHQAALSQVKAPVIPVMRFPDGSWHNDSTPLIYALEGLHPGARSVLPPDPARAPAGQAPGLDEAGAQIGRLRLGQP